jgi:outer membrane protein assembly factor BamB
MRAELHCSTPLRRSIGNPEPEDVTRAFSQLLSSAIFSSPAVANGVVYVVSSDHNVYALNAATEAPLWQQRLGDGVNASVVVANGVLYISGNDTYLYAFGS